MPKFPAQDKSTIDRIHQQNMQSMNKKIKDLDKAQKITKSAQRAQVTASMNSSQASNQVQENYQYESVQQDPEIPFREAYILRGRPQMTFAGNIQ